MEKDTAYVFQDGMNYAIREGKVISSNENLAELEKRAADAEEEHGDSCNCAECVADREARSKESASYIVTPNGLRGKILGKVQDVWGDKVTVRFDNGRIAHLDVVDGLKYETVKEAKAVDPLASLEARVSATYDDPEARVAELTRIIDQASAMVRSAALEEASRLDGIVVSAEVERQAIKDHLAYLASEEAEAFEAPAPFRIAAYEQASMGHDASWLDAVTQDLIKEAEATDFEKVMEEEPALFVSSVDDGALAETGTVREMAARFIRTKTAGVSDDSLRDRYEKLFLERVEAARRDELGERKQNIHKEAAKHEEQVAELPDDFLW